MPIVARSSMQATAKDVVQLGDRVSVPGLDSTCRRFVWQVQARPLRLAEGYRFGVMSSSDLSPICTSDEALRRVAQLTDALGLGLDPQSVRPVAALQRLGVETNQSCEGHADHSLPYPWIQVEMAACDRLALLLGQYPLPGWDVCRGRLLPTVVLEKGSNDVDIAFSLLPRTTADMQALGAVTDHQHRAVLIERLPEHQAQLARWADQLLAL